LNVQYPLVNAVILVGGVALNRFGAKLARQRRDRRGLTRAAR
jgi:hypothetical protein